MSKIFSYKAFPILLRFGGLSGLGWLFDFFIYLSIISFNSITPFVANLISSTIAAILVFILSRMFIFDKAEGAFLLRLTMFYSYSVMAIIASSFMIKFTIEMLDSISTQHEFYEILSYKPAIAKILVTPPLLMVNFVISKILIERRFI